MQRSVGREDIGPVVRRTVYSSKGRHAPAGLLDQQRSGKRVPGAHAALEKRVKPPASDVRERQSRRAERTNSAGDPEESAQVLCVSVEHLTVRGLNLRRDQA